MEGLQKRSNLNDPLFILISVQTFNRLHQFTFQVRLLSFCDLRYYTLLAGTRRRTPVTLNASKALLMVKFRSVDQVLSI